MAFNYNKLRGRIKELFGTQEKCAEAWGMSSVSLSDKLNNKVEFTSKEIEKGVDILDIPKEKIPVYFFNVEVQLSEQ